MADGDGGFGDVEVTVDAGEQQLTEQDVTPQGVVQPEPTPGDEADDAGDWTEGLDPAVQEFIRGKGFKAPADALRAYAEAERLRGEQTTEVGALRRELEEMAQEMATLRASQTSPPPPQAEPGVGLPDWGQMGIYAQQVAQRIHDGDVETEAGIADLFGVMTELSAARERALEERLTNAFQERVTTATGPLVEWRQTAGYQQQIRQMQQEFGDQYEPLARRAGELLEQWGRSDPSFVKNPTSIRVAFNEAFRESAMAERRAASAETLNGAGPGPSGREVDPAKLVVDSILSAGGGPSSGGFT